MTPTRIRQQEGNRIVMLRGTARHTPLTTTLSMLFALGGVLVLLHIVATVVFGYGYFRDELYYLVCGQRLAWGYIDHPPLTPAIARVVVSTLGDSVVALRLLPAFAGAGVVVLAGLMARQLGGGRWAQLLAGLAALVPPVYLATTSIFTTISFDHFFWALCAFLVVRLLATDNPRYWLAIGVVLGVGGLNKHNIALLGIGLAAGLLLTRTREHLSTRWPWLGVLAALLVVLPHLIWQAANGWPVLEFAANAATGKQVRMSPPEFLIEQVVSLHPVTLPIWLMGLGYFLFGRTSRRYRLIAWAYLVPLGVLLATGAGRADYLSPAYPVLFAGGAVAIERLLSRRGVGWLRPVLPIVLLLGGLAVLPAGIPLLPAGAMAQYAGATGLSERELEQGKTASLPQWYADQFGWEELVIAVADVRDTLPPEERATVKVLTGNYGEAGAIDILGRESGLPHAISGHNTYHLWGPGPEPTGTVIAVGLPLSRLQEVFGSVEQAGVVRCVYCMDYENNLPVYIARNPKRPLAEVWDVFKHYD
ncbi:MAG: glycosyltransferase family 39 protein [Chloroflexia bacterium]|nr:glycosyltransferase family 39 protein [Chloroflexia bacterium]